jgi:hypothetical protein
MRDFLVIPRPPIHVGGYSISSDASLHIRLFWRPDHPASSYGLGVLLIGRQVFDGHFYRAFREAFGAWIETDEPARVAGALGIDESEVGCPNKLA